MELILALAIGVLTGSGVWLLLRPRTFQVIMGLSLLSYAVNLFIFSMGRLGLAIDKEPVLQPGVPQDLAHYADPMPQALTLTAIVIGFAMTALFLVVLLASRGMAGTDHVDGTRAKDAQDARIHTMLEVEAFSDIHRRWKNLGYPFQHLVPSLATALGSSGDRPAALAELMGIIQNDGIRQPVLRIDELHFAADTPYETRVERNTRGAKRVMPSEVAAALRNALSQVVEGGTARRLQGTFQLQDGRDLTLGGKTGTGDNRMESVGAGGRVISSRAMNRTATFVFFLGPRHYGTLTAFVPGREAERFTFTSALPVQVLKGMAPILTPYLEPGSVTLCQAPQSAPQISWR